MMLSRIVLAFAAFASASVAAACPPAGWDRAKLTALKKAEFAIADQGERERFAEAVVACVASSDSALRDGIAFEALSFMFRQEKLGDAVKVRIARDLLKRLSSRAASGFEAPFAALVLAEVVRADGLKAYLPGDLRAAIGEGAVTFVAGVRDYRGFDEREGWRHGVAHGADLLMQIVRNTAYADPSLLERLRDVVASQVAPSAHFYIYGEPERLMMPVIFLAQRKVFTEAEWSAWFERVSDAAPLKSWDEAFASQKGLAKRHNTRAFLYAVWLNAKISESGDDDVLLKGAEAALRKVP
jgi:Protein of unknown function (DUF2785)